MNPPQARTQVSGAAPTSNSNRICGAFFNEFERFSAAWLRQLFPGATVDERSIADLETKDLSGHERVHLFAGIGGWEYALRLAGWPADRPVWTGSCPCQPFSSAGKGQGEKDPRHLWPEMFRLVAECHPDTIFGEQVASAIGHGWLDRVFADLEGEGYTCGAVVLGAHSVGAPHIRQRLYWVANSPKGRRGSGRTGEAGNREQAREEAERLQPAGGLVNTAGFGPGRGREDEAGESAEMPWAGHESRARRMGDADKQPGKLDARELPREEAQSGRRGKLDGDLPFGSEHASEGVGAWNNFEWIPCLDGKARRTQSGIFPLAHGVSARVGRLRGYGNAIVPQVAAQFIQAFLANENNAT